MRDRSAANLLERQTVTVVIFQSRPIGPDLLIVNHELMENHRIVRAFASPITMLDIVIASHPGQARSTKSLWNRGFRIDHFLVPRLGLFREWSEGWTESCWSGTDGMENCPRYRTLFHSLEATKVVGLGSISELFSTSSDARRSLTSSLKS